MKTTHMLTCAIARDDSLILQTGAQTTRGMPTLHVSMSIGAKGISIDPQNAFELGKLLLAFAEGNGVH